MSSNAITSKDLCRITDSCRRSSATISLEQPTVSLQSRVSSSHCPPSSRELAQKHIHRIICLTIELRGPLDARISGLGVAIGALVVIGDSYRAAVVDERRSVDRGEVVNSVAVRDGDLQQVGIVLNSIFGCGELQRDAGAVLVVSCQRALGLGEEALVKERRPVCLSGKNSSKVRRSSWCVGVLRS